MATRKSTSKTTAAVAHDPAPVHAVAKRLGVASRELLDRLEAEQPSWKVASASKKLTSEQIGEIDVMFGLVKPAAKKAAAKKPAAKKAPAKKAAAKKAPAKKAAAKDEKPAAKKAAAKKAPAKKAAAKDEKPAAKKAAKKAPAKKAAPKKAVGKKAPAKKAAPKKAVAADDAAEKPKRSTRKSGPKSAEKAAAKKAPAKKAAATKGDDNADAKSAAPKDDKPRREREPRKPRAPMHRPPEDGAEIERIAREYVDTALKGMGINARTSASYDGRLLQLNLRGPGAIKLLGSANAGATTATVDAFQLVISKAVFGDISRDKVVRIDAGGFRESRVQAVEKAAKRAVDFVKHRGLAVRFPVMNAMDRYAFHNTAGKSRGVIVESDGEGVFRMLTIDPVIKERPSENRASDSEE